MPGDIRLRLGGAVRKLRRRRKITQQQLAELADLDYKHIQLLEGKRTPYARLDTLVKLAKALNVPLSKLIREAERGSLHTPHTYIGREVVKLDQSIQFIE